MTVVTALFDVPVVLAIAVLGITPVVFVLVGTFGRFDLVLWRFLSIDFDKLGGGGVLFGKKKSILGFGVGIKINLAGLVRVVDFIFGILKA